jgi:hypothetical protein
MEIASMNPPSISVGKRSKKVKGKGKQQLLPMPHQLLAAAEQKLQRQLAAGSSSFEPGTAMHTISASVTPAFQGGRVQPEYLGITRQANPKRVPPSVQQFWHQQEKQQQANSSSSNGNNSSSNSSINNSNSGNNSLAASIPVHHSIGLSASSFDLVPASSFAQPPAGSTSSKTIRRRPHTEPESLLASGSKCGNLEVSREMQENLFRSMAASLGTGYWTDEFASPLARPLDATTFCSRQLQLLNQSTAPSLNASTAALQTAAGIAAGTIGGSAGGASASASVPVSAIATSAAAEDGRETGGESLSGVVALGATALSSNSSNDNKSTGNTSGCIGSGGSEGGGIVNTTILAPLTTTTTLPFATATFGTTLTVGDSTYSLPPPDRFFLYNADCHAAVIKVWVGVGACMVA